MRPVAGPRPRSFASCSSSSSSSGSGSGSGSGSRALAISAFPVRAGSAGHLRREGEVVDTRKSMCGGIWQEVVGRNTHCDAQQVQYHFGLGCRHSPAEKLKYANGMNAFDELSGAPTPPPQRPAAVGMKDMPIGTTSGSDMKVQVPGSDPVVDRKI
eukprot:gene7954-biopygen22582